MAIDNVGVDWFSTIYLDSAINGSEIHLAGVEEGLSIYIDANVHLTPKNVHELVLALGRYERWLKAGNRQ